MLPPQPPLTQHAFNPPKRSHRALPIPTIVTPHHSAVPTTAYMAARTGQGSDRPSARATRTFHRAAHDSL
ncbi:hypothetical protein [Leptolyngbya sp. BC1307]|uniref:hypothetical protein n=1 Tax=Leptolyngbya sp. BC1307 TaxID=2029589 RepID=UPI001140F091|nr:hypothetical protein [Leptolyngbya sp. BC1307]